MTKDSAPVVAKSFFVRDLKPKDQVQTTLLVKSKVVAMAKNAKPFISLVLGDCTGEIDSRIFDNADATSELFEEGDVIAVSGRVQSYNSRLQLVVTHLVPVPAAEVNLVDYLPQAAANLDEKYAELLAIFEKIQDPWVKEVSLRLLKNPEIASRYKICPAAKTIHHAYLGGLLVHVLSLLHLVEVISPLYPFLRKDLLLFGAAFHDFGKIYELSYSGAFNYTDEGKLIGHISIGSNLLDREIQKMPDFPRALEFELKHLVLSHHGKMEYGSPKEPFTLEAEVLQHLDNMDSKIESIQSLITNTSPEARWTPMHKAYGRSFFNPLRS